MYHRNEIATYEEARTFLSGGRSKDSRPIANNTRVETRDGDAIAVLYHSTDVVTYYPDGRVRLLDGGYQSYTTKDRFNRFSPMQVWSEGNGIWAAATGPDSARYENGLTMGPDGTFQTWKAGRYEARKAEEETRTGPAREITEHLRKRVQEYAAGFARAVSAGDVGNPSAGDCLYCQMANGASPMGSDHILSHLEEAYYVPGLLWNAIVARGYNAPDFIWSYWRQEPARFTSDITRAVTRYLYAELGLVR